MAADPLSPRRSPLRVEQRERIAGAGLFAFWSAVALATPSSLIDHSDESNFMFYADRIVHGHYALRGGPDVDFLWFGPGLPAVLAPLHALGLGLAIMRLLGPLLLTAGVLLLHRLLLRYVGPRLALAGAGALALYFPLWRLLPRIYAEPLALVLLLGAALLGSAGMASGSRARLAGAGLLLGGLAMVRLEYGTVLQIVLVMCVVWALVQRALVQRRSPIPRRAVAMLAVSCLACVPWLTYTHHLTHKTMYWGNSGGLSLYWMAPQFSADEGEPHPIAEVFTDPDLARHRPYFRSIASLGPVAHDEELRRRSKELIRADPGGYAIKLIKNFSRLWLRWPYSYERVGPKTLFYALPGGALLLALLASAVVLARGRSRLHAPELVPFALIGLGGLAVHVVVAGYPRSIAPLVPLALLAVALAVDVLQSTSARVALLERCD